MERYSLILLCNTCDVDKPDEAFEVVPANKNLRGRAGWCRECRNAYHRGYQKEWKKKFPHKVQEFKRKDLLKKYGLDFASYTALCTTQNNACAICLEVLDLNVDHCHLTGQVRGLLCGVCNRLLGHAKDNIERLSSAIRYLEKWKGIR